MLLQIVPAVASQMVTLVHNLADTYFVGMLNAPHETAAVTVAYPSFLMLTAISNLFGVGGASAIARALGRQDEEGARRIAAVSLAGGLLSALHLVEKGITSGDALRLGVINKAFDPFERQLVADAVWSRIPQNADRAKLFGN